MSDYDLVVGLEVHARIKTKSKLFCSCSNDTFSKSPNIHICSVCTGLPGQLPLVNEEAVKKTIMTGHALQAKICQFSKFDRKSYFYPDNPKGYQITQYEEPLVKDGMIEIWLDGEKKKFRINRIHIEDDAGKLMHSTSGTLVDLNRAGSPLMEIVTEPDFNSIKEVSLFFKELQKILRYVDSSDADMEKGMLRADVNISLKNKGNSEFGTRVEIKNMNSFSAVEKAIAYEQKRQEEILQKGGVIEQETRGWDVKNEKSVIQRTKEDAADYRYFPEPDLPPIIIEKEEINKIKKSLPELPMAKYERFLESYKISDEDAFLLTESIDLADFYEKVVQKTNQPKKAANWILSELMRFLNEDNITIVESKVTADYLAEIINLVEEGVISGKIAKEVLFECYNLGQAPALIVDQKGLKQNSNQEELQQICNEVIKENSQILEQYLAGKTKVFGAFVGQVMKKTKGQANPKLVNEILQKLLKEPLINS